MTNLSLLYFFIHVLHILFIDCKENTISEWVIKVPGGRSEALAVAKRMRLKFVDKMLGMDDYYILESGDGIIHKDRNSQSFLKRFRRNARTVSVYPQPFLKRVKRSITWNDPLYEEMWYLHRSKDNPNLYDMNVLEAWNQGMTGKGVVVTIMDDGVDYNHPDLRANYDPDASKDVNDRDQDPMPNVKDSKNHHGTRCAGQVAATGNNSVCIVGIAYEAKIGGTQFTLQHLIRHLPGIRMLDGKITDRVEAETLLFNSNHIDIYSGSWGPEDEGEVFEGPGQLASYAFSRGTSLGRNGLGNIFIWASGNGGQKGDSCAYDGYASSMFTISISSVSESNTRPWYLERCASTMATTYSSGGQTQRLVCSIDLFDKCTQQHSGTSASAPMAADVQYITVLTSNSQPFMDGRFRTNSAGLNYSIFYGFGLMDAGKMVRLGQLWRQLPPQQRCNSARVKVSKPLIGSFNITIPFDFFGCDRRSLVDSEMYSDEPISEQDATQRTRVIAREVGERVRYLEHVHLYLDIEYSYRGLLKITLISPSGTETEMLPTRLNDRHSGDMGFVKWPLMTVHLWGEEAVGRWHIRIDNKSPCEDIKNGFISPSEKLLDYDTCSRLLENVDHFVGQWKTAFLTAHGTEIFPIRLNPPLNSNQPPIVSFLYNVPPSISLLTFF
ncbi:Proprotein convertase subtilisin/kexin type 6 [Cichlidogyrus casuarinus]|uniref:Proprotein convertase subtilisin/kexin type 6 n=1 Tax=Cichlidogyrus casuarinus TaxID=1844966 RepID=A0ABD2QDZ1_9PLAT